MWPAIRALVWKQLRQRYRRNYFPLFFGVFYTVFSVGFFTVLFTKIAPIGSEGVPYVVFNFAGIVPWALFAAALQEACGSLTGNANLLTRLRFPRAALPVSAVLTGFPEFGLNALLLTALLIRSGLFPDGTVLWLVPLVFVQIVLAVGIGLLLSVFHAYFRMTSTLLRPLIQAWLLVSPVLYSLGSVKPENRALYLLNPMAGLIDGWRRVLLHHRAPDWTAVGTSFLVSAAMLVVGSLVFAALQKNVADVA